jgi:hypothetical protein
MGVSSSWRTWTGAAVVGFVALTLTAVWFETGVNRPVTPATEARAVEARPAPAAEPRLDLPAAAYVGDEVCAKCHAEIARTYSRHPMGRSMAKAADVLPDQVGNLLALPGAELSIERRDGKVIHRATHRAPTGQVIKSEEGEVRYALGSGTRGYSFLVERPGGLFQSPLSWYSEEHRWDIALGYQKTNPHFDRFISSLCLFCHTNRVEMEPGHPPVFHGLAIGCERCHGPGERHARNPTAVAKAGEAPAIINPDRLEPLALREEVCGQCHLQGSDRETRFGHSPFDYRPGLPLDDFIGQNRQMLKPKSGPSADAHMDQMRLSRCYRESDGRLGCTSCHDPHRIPEASERVAFFKSGCLKCHGERGCSLPAADRLVRSPADDCASCHMPRASAHEPPHVARTNHTIPRKPTGS